MPITAIALLSFCDMACSLTLPPHCQLSSSGAGARPDHPISRHRTGISLRLRAGELGHFPHFLVSSAMSLPKSREPASDGHFMLPSWMEFFAKAGLELNAQ